MSRKTKKLELSGPIEKAGILLIDLLLKLGQLFWCHFLGKTWPTRTISYTAVSSVHLKFRTESIRFCYVICSRYENEITCSWKLIIVIIAIFIYLHRAVWNVHSSCGISLKLAALFIVIARHLVLKSLLALETVPSWNLNHNILS